MLKFPKPTSRRKERAARRTQAKRSRAACVDAVWRRAGGRCEGCESIVKRASIYFAEVGHVHETVKRSQGGDPTDPDNCQLLCLACHLLEHGIRVRR